MTIEKFNLQTCESLYNEGYIVSSEKMINLYASRGKYLVLRKHLGIFERAGRVVGGILCCPVLCLPPTMCCTFFFYGNPCQLYSDHIYTPTVDGYYEKIGYLPDSAETKELRKKDYATLNLNLSDLESFINQKLAEDYPLSSHKEFPEHNYMTFYGPISKFSYVLLIPYGNKKEAQLFPVSNKEGQPCNSEELKKKSRDLCAGYKKGVRTVKVKTESTLVGKVDYGTYATGKVYLNVDKVVSN